VKKLMFACVFTLITNPVFADHAELNNTLVRVIQQMNAIFPLLDEAVSEMEPGARIQLHIDAFEGPDGENHPGVRTDLQDIRNALIDYINQPAIEPKKVKPLTFDFVGQ